MLAASRAGVKLAGMPVKPVRADERVVRAATFGEGPRWSVFEAGGGNHARLSIIDKICRPTSIKTRINCIRFPAKHHTCRRQGWASDCSSYGSGAASFCRFSHAPSPMHHIGEGPDMRLVAMNLYRVDKRSADYREMRYPREDARHCESRKGHEPSRFRPSSLRS